MSTVFKPGKRGEKDTQHHDNHHVHRTTKRQGKKLRLKPLKTQTVVITDASSGIGLVTARVTDKIMEWFFTPAQQTRCPERDPMTNSLYESSGDMQESAGYNGHVGKTSLYTQFTRHQVLTGAALAEAALALSAWWRDLNNGGRSRQPAPYAFRISPPSC